MTRKTEKYIYLEAHKPRLFFQCKDNLTLFHVKEESKEAPCMEYEDLIGRLFSDEEGDYKEYQLIEIDYSNPQPAIVSDDSEKGLSRGV